MFTIVISILLFGMVHPLSKWILDTGIPLSYFCVSYIGIRLLLQIPVVLRKKNALLLNKNLLLPLLGFGLIGAGLQFFEFKGIGDGLSPSTVTFLMFSYPIWIVVGKAVTGQSNLSEYFQSIAVVIGVFFVSGSAITEVSESISSIFFPLLAGLFIALWIYMSGYLGRKGMESTSMSFYYDLFSLLILLTLSSQQLSHDFKAFQSWFTITGLLQLSFYSVFIGWIPNILFYKGSKKVSVQTAGLAMSFEPVLSTVYSAMIWKITLLSSFWIGAVFILLGNLPLDILRNTFGIFRRFGYGVILSTAEKTKS